MTTIPATHAEALTILRSLFFGTQKARSNLRESLGDSEIAISLLEDGHPWLFGPKCPLDALGKAIARAEAGEPIAGSDLRNFLWIAELEPILGISAQAWLQDVPLPEPDMAMSVQTWTA